ncbi:deoxyribodipyrimidine photo-lyase-like isoform X1 [Zeugodacus cucurbitae]|uniref:deoxyribodipyrimidine photo-lyase-like isoform X1 n=1 Tax=Zeugodacus cucurbitae TaxID=28588 RepID=UPI0023D8E5CA|nr:deoxyribodipyrimidine photo-lyase-like isoform X1 [Zeugodacus cucurbitae]
MKRSKHDTSNQNYNLRGKAMSPSACEEEDISRLSPQQVISKQSLKQRRLSTAKSISEFPFNKRRVRVLSAEDKVSDVHCGGILYWMFRDARVQDNWALLFAQRLALKFELPLFITFCITTHEANITKRQYEFLLSGLEELAHELHDLTIPFHLCFGSAAYSLSEFVRLHEISAVVCDFSPLREQQQHVEEVRIALPEDVPLTQVDAHNVVPLWIASDKQEFVAYFMRRRINLRLNEFLTEFPPVIKHPYNKNIMNMECADWNKARTFFVGDCTVQVVKWAKPGYMAACAQLQSFCNNRLPIYSDKRNDPTVNALSGLSPWLHFGQISAQRCILEVNRYLTKYQQSVEAFCEEALIHRELADNFCYYNKNYDNLNGLYPWAIKTLNEHREDERNPSYTLSEFEHGNTYDDLWNASQLQLVREGKMHGFLRKYWAKKILEWSNTPESALETAIYLNDKYSLDGRDPNGYVGCMFSIGGLHDSGYANRPIYGKIRYMNYKGCQRKFNVTAFVARYNINDEID